MDFHALKERAICRGLAMDYCSPENATVRWGANEIFAFNFNAGTIIFRRKPDKVLALLKLVTEFSEYKLARLLSAFVLNSHLEDNHQLCPIWEIPETKVDLANTQVITLRQWLLKNGLKPQNLEG